MNGPPELSKFIIKRVADPKFERYPVASFVLLQVNEVSQGGNQHTEIDRFEWIAGPQGGRDAMRSQAEDVANEIFAAATNWANGLRQRVTFMVGSLVPLRKPAAAPHRPRPHRARQVDPDDDGEDDDHDDHESGGPDEEEDDNLTMGPGKITFFIDGAIGEQDFAMPGTPMEQPTERGISAMQMRHNERLIYLLTASNEQNLRHSRMTMDRLSEENRQLQMQRAETLRLQDEMLSRQHERNMEMEKARSRSERIDKFMDKGVSFLPIIMSKLLAPKAPTSPQAPLRMPSPQAAPAPDAPAAGPGEPATPDPVFPPPNRKVLDFFGSLTPEQQLVLDQNLSEEQKMMLLQIYMEQADLAKTEEAIRERQQAEQGGTG